MRAADELTKLKKLHDDGTITDEQYERAKAKVRDEDARADEEDGRDERRPRRSRRDDDEDEDDDERYALRRRARQKKVREWGMILHLSLFAGHVVPFGGIIAPILIWQMKKDEMPELDAHGRNAVNWLISAFIYAMICVPLIFVVVGIPLLIVLGVLNVVFPVIAAVKANEGRVWKYPLAISFFK